jgi:DNA-binding CsgD family transcriptional regulator
VAALETVSVLFADLTDTTSASVARLAQVIAHGGGEQAKSRGDRIMAVFHSASAALGSAVAMQQAVEEENRRTGAEIRLRVGLSAGEVRRDGDDYAGGPVTEASGLCDRSQGGQILCAALVKAMAGGRATQAFSLLGELQLDGLSEAVATIEVHWEPLPAAEAVPSRVGEPMEERLATCRELFRRKAWGDAFAALVEADREAPLEPEDLERLATAAYLLGLDDACDDAWSRAYQELVRRGGVERAARCAFWLAFGLLIRGEMAPAGGWLAKAGRLLEVGHDDCVERGYLMIPDAMGSMFGGDPAAGHAAATQAAEIGRRTGDANLLALSWLVQGSCLAMLGDAPSGLALLDEVMVAVTSDEVSPILAGLAYCAVISACQGCYDVRRAREWTAALSRWCACQPDLVTYRGQCLVHRSEILQLQGAWPDARAEAQRACERLSDPPGALLGFAMYQRGELHRLSGEYPEAEEAFRQASKWGHEPQPGLALLRLAQGQVDAAAAALSRVLDEVGDPPTKGRLLSAQVEIRLASGDVAGARAAAEELGAIAGAVAAPLFGAVSDYVTGAVLLAEGDARNALAALRRAGAAWREVNAPYEVARVRVLVALACRLLGDEDGAVMGLEAARHTFEELGAAPDLARVAALASPQTAPSPPVGGLTGREIEVLALVARGKTNRDIAGQLFISEHTVARHVQNIFTKLGLSSRSAATAFAFEHRLV